MVSLGKGSSLRRVALDDYDRCPPGNQLVKAAPLGERPQGHVQDSGPCHTMLVCKQRRHGQLPYLGIMPRDFTMARPARHSGRYCNPMAERKDFWQLAPMGGAYPWLPLRSLCCHLDNRSRDCLGSSSRSILFSSTFSSWSSSPWWF